MSPEGREKALTIGEFSTLTWYDGPAPSDEGAIFVSTPSR